ncbi:MAG TPA: hypothetical protein PLJ17_10185 [Syntrophorhabdaceae bacterium]|nr:hypothetical protein [Syntrophorhabdaceae bacterium]HQE81134.1 hypothetical protein [Syntrophorhabdaceae bacterium]HQH44129.1 hypothetical protein [Syntrophorhabdaceae bacterium]
MKKQALFVLIFCFMTVILCPPVYSQSAFPSQSQEKDRYETSGTLILADLIIMRPLGIAACAIGAAGVIISLPFVAFTGGLETVVDQLLTKPGNFTFERRLGDFGFTEQN